MKDVQYNTYNAIQQNTIQYIIIDKMHVMTVVLPEIINNSGTWVILQSSKLSVPIIIIVIAIMLIYLIMMVVTLLILYLDMLLGNNQVM